MTSAAAAAAAGEPAVAAAAEAPADDEEAAGGGFAPWIRSWGEGGFWGWDQGAVPPLALLMHPKALGGSRGPCQAQRRGWVPLRGHDAAAWAPLEPSCLQVEVHLERFLVTADASPLVVPTHWGFASWTRSRNDDLQDEDRKPCGGRLGGPHWTGEGGASGRDILS